MSKLKGDIIRLRAEGKTYTEIQQELICSKGTISYHLGAGQKEKNVSRQKVRRAKARAHMQEVKQNTPCTDCGEHYPYWIMEFDHLGDKNFSLSNATRQGKTLEVIKEEISKCEVVCANCHKNRTYRRLLKNGDWTFDVTEYYAS